MKNIKDIIKEDHTNMVEYVNSSNWEILDYYISDIISSNDPNRMYGVLVLFKQFKDDIMFKDCLETISKKLENEGFSIR